MGVFKASERSKMGPKDLRGVKNTKSTIFKEIMKLECSNFTNMYYKLVGEKNNNICAILK